jgi:hypothetical protein
MCKITNDSFPEAIAIRVYVGFLLFYNNLVFKICENRRIQSLQNSGLRKWLLCPAVGGESIKEATERDEFRSFLLSDLESYFAIENNLSPAFTVFSSLGGKRTSILSVEDTAQYLMSVLPSESSGSFPFTANFLEHRLKLVTVKHEKFDITEERFSRHIRKDLEFLRPMCISGRRQPWTAADARPNVLRPSFDLDFVMDRLSNSTDQKLMLSLARYGESENIYEAAVIARIALELTVSLHSQQQLDLINETLVLNDEEIELLN